MDPQENSDLGLRHRFVTQDPAPVPAVTPVTTLEAETPAAPESTVTSDSDVVASTGSMAIATLCSRITGFLRNVLIVTTLGSAISSAFNVANTLPNLITEIVLGAVLTSLVVPVLVRAEKEDPDKGERFIRQLFTLGATLLGAVTIISVLAAPLLAQLMLSKHGKVNLVQATSFAYLLLPQIFFYGLFALLMAVLNTKGVFKPGAWAPVVNNLIVLAVMISYRLLPGALSPSEAAGVFDPHILLLGLGTTTGVVVQALILLPALRRCGVSLRPLWGIDARLKQFAGMAVAIIVYVAISQYGYTITTRIASHADEAAPNIYQQAWLLLQMPYGIIGVTLLTAIMPRLSRNAADGDDKAVVRDLVLGSKLTYVALIPIVVFLSAFGTHIAVGLFAYGEFGQHVATILGLTISFSAFTLLPYATVLLHLRVFYAREEAWTPTFIIAGITITKVLLSMLAPVLATSAEDVVILLGAANGFGFIAGAIIGAFLLRRKLGSLAWAEVMKSALWAFGASLVGIAIVGPASFLFHHFTDSSLGHSAWYLVELTVLGTVFLVIVGLILSRSKLEELGAVAGVARRIPGLRPKQPQPLPTQPHTQAAMTADALAFDDSFNATPVPPPMSAGVVRGPRLIAGAEVADGRFRLLADHGSVQGARFWQAKEKESGLEVALTFVDTTPPAPVTAHTRAAAAGAAAEVCRRTRKLSAVNHPAIARILQVLPYREGALIVSEWVPGRSLADVATMHPDPQAAIQALQPLAAASLQAHAAHTVLGLDNRARIRVSTAGQAVLAFPAVLPQANQEQDLNSLRAGLATLVADSPLLERDAAEVVRSIAGEQLTPAQALDIEEESTPQPASRPGFGRAGYSKKALGLLSALAVSLVIVIALLTAYLTSLLGAETNTPVTPVISGEETQAPAVDLVRPLSGIRVFNPDAQTDPASAKLAIDSDLGTGWPIKPSQGLLLETKSPGVLNQVVLHMANDSVVDFKVYGIPALRSAENSTAGLPLLNEMSVHSLQGTIPISSRQEFSGLIIVVNSQDLQVDNAINEIIVVGH